MLLLREAALGVTATLGTANMTARKNQSPFQEGEHIKKITDSFIHYVRPLLRSDHLILAERETLTLQGNVQKVSNGCIFLDPRSPKAHDFSKYLPSRAESEFFLSLAPPFSQSSQNTACRNCCNLIYK